MLDSLRAIPGKMGLHPHKVTVRVRTWAGGSRPAEHGSTFTDVDTVLRVGGQNPKVAQVSQKDVIASGGSYTDRRVKVGPLTPPFPGGGTEYTTLDPPKVASPVEVFWKIEGDGYPPGGSWFTRVSDEDSALHSYVILQATGEQPGT